MEQWIRTDNIICKYIVLDKPMEPLKLIDTPANIFQAVNTMAGRVQMLDTLMERLTITPEQYRNILGL